MFPFLLLAEYVFWTAPRVCLLSEGGCNSSGIWFVRPDFLIPSCVKEEGPSATIFFHGGDSGFRRGIVGFSLTRRFLLGGSPSAPFSPPCPFVRGFSSSSIGVSRDKQVSYPQNAFGVGGNRTAYFLIFLRIRRGLCHDFVREGQDTTVNLMDVTSDRTILTSEDAQPLNELIYEVCACPAIV